MASAVASESTLANWLYMFVEYNDGLKELVENVGCDGVVVVGVVNTLVGFFDDAVKGVVFNEAGGETQLVSVGVVVVVGGGT